MSKISAAFSVRRRSKKEKSFILSLNPASGLSPEICRQWQRKGFSRFPPELAAFKNPSSKSAAGNGALALIEFLKKRTPAAASPDANGGACDVSNGNSLVSFLTAFWSPGSEYIREQEKVNKTPLCSTYIMNNQRNIRLHISTCPLLSNLPLSGLTRKIIRSYKLWAVEKGMSGDLANKCLKTMSVAVRYAVSNGDLPADPFYRTGKIYHKEKTKGVITLAERAALIGAPVIDYYARLSVLLGALCGMRRGEIRGLLWGDIGDGIITVRHNWVEGDGAKNPKCKGGLIQENTRATPMPRVIADLLNAIYKDRTEYAGPHDFVIRSVKRKGIPVSAKYFDHAMKREMAGIGVSKEEQKRRNITFHSTRHTFVTLGKLTGFSDLELQVFAGQTEKTQRRYTHGEQVIDMEAARQKLDNSLLPVKANIETAAG